MIDEDIAEIREIRHKISAQFGHAPYKLVDYYRAMEKKCRESGEFKFAKTFPEKSKNGMPEVI